MDPYAPLARFYDLDHADFHDDLDGWVGLARQSGGPALEVGCGSGRVLLALAAAGIDVVGIDTSPPMLERARTRLAEAGDLPGTVTLHDADVRAMRLPEGPGAFRLALATLGVFGHLLTHADAARALRRLHAHLAEAGLVVIDQPNPLTLTDDLADGLLFHDWTRQDPETGHTIVRLHSRRTDPAAQRIETTFFYDEVAPDGALRRTLAPVTLRWYSAPELELLLDAAGFAVEALYGDWEMSDWAADSPRLIVVARKNSG